MVVFIIDFVFKFGYQLQSLDKNQSHLVDFNKFNVRKITKPIFAAQKY